MIADIALNRRSPQKALFNVLLTALGLAGCYVSSGPEEPARPATTTTRARRSDAKRPPSDDEQPYADMARTLGTVTSVPVRGRLVEEEGQPNLIASTPA